MHRERFPGRVLGRESSTFARAVQHQLSPGKRTLTEALVVQRREATPEPELATNGTTASAPAPPPIGAGGDPRPNLQMLFGVPRSATAVPAEDPAKVHAAAARGIATEPSKLPFADQIQRAFGRHDISGIHAHVGGEAAKSAREMGARAYATGDHVVLGEGADLHTVAHEAAHVVQQRGGVQLKGGVGEVGDAYERQADAVADAVVAGRDAAPLLGPPGNASASPVELSPEDTPARRDTGLTRGATYPAGAIQRKISFEAVEEAFHPAEMEEFAAWTAEWLDLVIELTKEKENIDEELIREAQGIILEAVDSPDELRALLATHKKRIVQHRERSRDQDDREIDQDTLNRWILNSPAGPYVKGKAGVESIAVLDPRTFNQRVVMDSYLKDVMPDDEISGEGLEWRTLILNAAITGDEDGFTERTARGNIVVRTGTPPHVAIHEAVHAFANPEFRAKLGDMLDEGATELITQWIAKDLGLESNGYPRSVATIEKLRTFLKFSPDDLMKAYFVDPGVLVRWTRMFVGDEYLQTMKEIGPRALERDEAEKQKADTAFDRGRAQKRDEHVGYLKLTGIVLIVGAAIAAKILGLW